MIDLKKYTFSFSLCVIVIIYILNKVPLSDFLESYGYNNREANWLEDLLFNSLVIVFITSLIISRNIPFSLWSNDHTKATYYLPLLFSVFIFSGGFSGVQAILVDLSISSLLLYSSETLIAALLEEFVFRGLILGLLVLKYEHTGNRIWKVLFFSSLIFGSTHILNLWSQNFISVKSVFNQLYATTSLGFLFGVVYLKTRNILVLALIHFASNFLAGLHSIDTLTLQEVVNSESPSVLNEIVTEFFRLLIFGFPFLIGLFTMRFIKQSDIDSLINSKN